MPKLSYIFCLFPFLITFNGVAQTVKTLPLKGLDGPNGFALDKDGRLYIANERGKKVIRVVGDSITEEVIVCDSPDGLAFDDKGNLYISNFFSGVILRKTDHSVDTFAKGLSKPADIKFDDNRNLYVAEYENGTIKKINNRGEITEFASGLQLPFGLVFDDKKNLYVANNTTGIISKINPAGTVSFFSQVPGSISYLTYSKKTGKLYAASFTRHNIYSVTKEGRAEMIVGKGEGYKDGNWDEAQFKGPNSIIISDDGDLYISEFSDNRIRKIMKIDSQRH
jgi:DNA-binding beta-propeller fold protein YncE